MPQDILGVVDKQQSKLAESQQQYPSLYLQTNESGTCLDTTAPDLSGIRTDTAKWLYQVLF